jgi:putative FmdB family regulatory protein
MPIYEYKCPKCGTFEATQRITDSPLRRCPTCKGKVTKLISSTSFQLKGTGWYVTDYAGKKEGAKKEDATKEDATKEGGATKSKEEGKTESTEAAKTSTDGGGSKDAKGSSKGASKAAAA